MKKKTFAYTAVLFLALGCASTSSDPNVDAWEKEVRILAPSQLGDRQYEELGGTLETKKAVRSSYGGEDAAIDAARRELRRRAAELDADAVVVYECGRHVRPIEEDMMPKTGPEIVCHGVAIRWLD
jgi:hypothetical protein